MNILFTIIISGRSEIDRKRACKPLRPRTYVGYELARMHAASFRDATARIVFLPCVVLRDAMHSIVNGRVESVSDARPRAT